MSLGPSYGSSLAWDYLQTCYHSESNDTYEDVPDACVAALLRRSAVAGTCSELRIHPPGAARALHQRDQREFLCIPRHILCNLADPFSKP